MLQRSYKKECILIKGTFKCTIEKEFFEFISKSGWGQENKVGESAI